MVGAAGQRRLYVGLGGDYAQRHIQTNAKIGAETAREHIHILYLGQAGIKFGQTAMHFNSQQAAGHSRHIKQPQFDQPQQTTAFDTAKKHITDHDDNADCRAPERVHAEHGA